MENDDLKDLLALGGAINQQINASNSMIIEKGKSTIPTLNARQLMDSVKINNNQRPEIAPLPISEPVILNDPNFQGFNISPMASLIPLDEALTDDMRKRGIQPKDLIESLPMVNQSAKINSNVPNAIPPMVPVKDKNQIEFGFVDKLQKNEPKTLIEYLDEKFLEIEIKLGNINSKLDKIINKRNKT